MSKGHALDTRFVIFRGFPLWGLAALILTRWSLADNALPFDQPDWVISSWEARDRVKDIGYAAAAAKLAEKLDEQSPPHTQGFAKARNATEAAARATYLQLAQIQRAQLLEPHLDRIRRIVFAKHRVMGGRSHYAYTEGLTDHPESSMGDRGGGLYLLTIDDQYRCTVESLIETPSGILRDPDVSFDGKRILFSKRDTKNEDYHLFEMNVADRGIRQITFGEAHADIEPAYLPGGGIVFNSTRCVQDVDCFPRPASNFFLCDGEGRFIRRIGYDQVHTNYPTVMSNGLVLYTRWEYNDRKQYQTQCLFMMYPDGTNQQEFFGNNSVFPTSILHAREIPGTDIAVAILSGHHTQQQGYLALIDPSKGDDGLQSVLLLAPEREPVDPGPKGSGRDFYAQTGDVYQYPYPLDENSFLATHRYIDNDAGNKPPFNIVFVNRGGDREILASDPAISCAKPIPLGPRPIPHMPSSRVDYRKTLGECNIIDVYHGESSEGIARGTIEKIRIVGLDYRARSLPPGAAGTSYTPIACGSGAWDIKVVVGEAEVYEDGSAWFIAPARMPLYFQLVDTSGFVAQTMRSWTTLQPGEAQNCIGCHEKKSESPISKTTIAQSRGVQPLKQFYGPMRGFSFDKEIQPILNKKCITCHDGGIYEGVTTVDFRGIKPAGDDTFRYYSGQNRRGGKQSVPQYGPRNSSRAYWNMLAYVEWLDALGPPELLAPYQDGSFESDLIRLLDQGHKDVTLTNEERDKLCCWIDLCVPYAGDYMEDMWQTEAAIYQHWLDKRNAWLVIEDQNIQKFIESTGVGTGFRIAPKAAPGISAPAPIAYGRTPLRQANVFVVNAKGQLVPQGDWESAAFLRRLGAGVFFQETYIGNSRKIHKILIKQ